MINENLKQSPFKIIHMSLGKVTINKPSLNLITQKISIEINNIDVIIMPLFRTKKESESQGQEHDENEEEKEKPESQEITRSEEFNVIFLAANNLMSDFEQLGQQNTFEFRSQAWMLDCQSNDQGISSRQDMIFDSLDAAEDIPTLLLRLNQIEYKRTKDIDPNQRPISDMHVILDGKSLEVQEISLHLMKNVRLSSDESKIKDPQLLRLKFPQEYPVINHPSTIFLIKPMINQGSFKAIEAHLWFKDPSENHLSLSVKINNIESISSLDQIKVLLRFTSDINSYFQNKPIDNIKSKADQDLDSQDLDQYGTIIAGKNIDNGLDTPFLKKSKSQQVKSKSPEQQPKKKKNKKSILNTEKLLIKMLQKSQHKQAFDQLRDDIKKSQIMSEKNQQEELAKIGLDQSIFQSTTNFSQRKQPLSFTIDFKLHKISIIFQFKEVDIAYDHFYDSFAQAYHLIHSDMPPNNIYDDRGNFMRVDQKIGYSHYDLEMRDFYVYVNLSYPKFKNTNKTSKKIIFLKKLDIKSSLKYCQLRRYDLSEGYSLQALKQLEDIQRLNLEQTTFNQYESLSSQSGIFQSALEFHRLDSTNLEQSKYMMDKSTISQKRGQHSHGQGQLQKSYSMASQGEKQQHQSQENFFIFNLSKLNNNRNHFCSQCILDIRPLTKSDYGQNVFWTEISIFDEKQNLKQVQGSISLGSIFSAVGIHEVVFIGQALKDKRFRDAPQMLQIEQTQEQLKNTKKNVTTNIQIKIDIPSVQVSLFGDSSEIFNLDRCYGDVIQNQSIENLCPQTCYCHQSDHLNDNALLKLSLQSINATVEGNNFYFSIEQIELYSKLRNQTQIDLIHAQKWTIDIDNPNNVPNIIKDSITKSQAEEKLQKSEDDHISIVNSDENNESSSSNQETAVVFVNVKVDSLQMDILASNLEQYLMILKKVDKSIKFIQLLIDYHKCFNVEHTNNQGKIKPPLNENFGVKVQIKDCNVFLHETIDQLLMQFCLHKVSVDVIITMIKDFDKFNIKFSTQDIMLLDFLTQSSVFPPELIKNQHIPEGLDKVKMLKTESQFLNELQENAQYVILYRQQGLRGEQFAFKIDFDVKFDLTKKYHSIMSTEVLAEFYTDSHCNYEGNEIIMTYEKVMRFKRNPMKADIQIGSKGLIFSLKIQHHLAAKILSIIETAQSFTDKIQQPVFPEINPNSGAIQDEIKLKITLEDFMVDYFPSLTAIEYDSAYHEDMLVINYAQKEEDFLYKTSVRTILYLQSLSIDYAFVQKENRQEINVNLTNFDVNLLKNNSCHPYLNPTLLLDDKDPININGKDSYMDYLGFAQIFSLDLLTFSYKIMENIENKDKEENLFLTDYQFHTAFIPNPSTETQMMTQNNKSDKKELKLNVQKIGFYIAKDSYQTIKLLINIVTQQLKRLQKMFSKVSVNTHKKNKQNIPQENEENKGDSEEVDEDIIKRIIDTFVLLNNPERQEQLQNQEELKEQFLQRKQIEDQHLIQQEGYFVVNLETISFEPKQDRDIQNNEIIQKYVKEQYIQEFKEEDYKDDRYKWFHNLPQKYKHFFIKTKICIEFQNFEVKLYQGKDFDFAVRKNLPQFKTGLNQYDQSTFFSMGQSHRISQSIYILQENYMPEESKKPQQIKQGLKQSQGKTSSLTQSQLKTSVQLEEQQRLQQKRIRKTYRGFYLCGSLSNVVISYHNLKYLTLNEDVDYNRYSFSIQKIILKETVSRKGTLVRELIQMPYSYLYDNQIEILATHNLHERYDEVGLSTKFQPFKLMLNQGSVSLIQNFFDIDFQSKKDEVQFNQEQITIQVKNQSKQISKKPIFVTKLKIHPFQVVLSYTSHKLDIKDLYYGNYIEYLNIFNINDMKLNFKEFTLDQRMELEYAIRAFQIYLEDLIDKQKINVVKAIGPLRSFFNLAGAFYGVFRKPYHGYYSDKGFVKGLNEGVWDLYQVVTKESVNFTNKLKDGYVKIKKAAEKHL